MGVDPEFFLLPPPPSPRNRFHSPRHFALTSALHVERWPEGLRIEPIGMAGIASRSIGLHRYPRFIFRFGRPGRALNRPAWFPVEAVPQAFAPIGSATVEAGERLLKPVEKLGGRIDLVVMLAIGKHSHLVQVFGKPRCILRDRDKAVFDHCGLRVQPHDLLALRLVAGDTVAALADQFLDQLGARGLVLNQHDIGTEQVLLFAHRALEGGIFEPLAQHTQEINFFAADTPSRADAKITELSRLVGSVPALHDAVKALRSFLVVITLEPFGLDQTPAQGRGGLLILASKVVLADRPPEMSECREWLALGVQRLAPLTPEAARAPDRVDRMHLVDLGDRRKADDLPE